MFGQVGDDPMARLAARRADVGSVSLADLLTVLRVARHCNAPAAVDAPWRIRLSPFPMEALVEVFDAAQVLSGGPAEKKH